MSITKKILIGTAIGSGTVVVVVVAGPLILPAGAIVAGKTVIAAAIAKATTIAITAKSCAVAAVHVAIAVAPIAGPAAATISVGRLARPYVISTAEEKLNALKKDENLKFSHAKKELIDCLTKHGTHAQGNNLIIPTPCEQAAFKYELLDDE